MDRRACHAQGCTSQPPHKGAVEQNTVSTVLYCNVQYSRILYQHVHLSAHGPQGLPRPGVHHQPPHKGAVEQNTVSTVLYCNVQYSTMLHQHVHLSAHGPQGLPRPGVHHQPPHKGAVEQNASLYCTVL